MICGRNNARDGTITIQWLSSDPYWRNWSSCFLVVYTKCVWGCSYTMMRITTVGVFYEIMRRRHPSPDYHYIRRKWPVQKDAFIMQIRQRTWFPTLLTLHSSSASFHATSAVHARLSHAQVYFVATHMFSSAKIRSLNMSSQMPGILSYFYDLPLRHRCLSSMTLGVCKPSPCRLKLPAWIFPPSIGWGSLSASQNVGQWEMQEVGVAWFGEVSAWDLTRYLGTSITHSI